MSQVPPHAGAHAAATSASDSATCPPPPPHRAARYNSPPSRAARIAPPVRGGSVSRLRRSAAGPSRWPSSPAPAPAPTSGSSSSGPSAPGSGYLANNIVQAAPKGAIALGASDPVHDYEEADKFQVVEVGAAVETSSATATLKAAAPAAAKKTLDGLTVSELKSELKRRGLSSLGTRRELITRLQQAGL